MNVPRNPPGRSGGIPRRRRRRRRSSTPVCITCSRAAWLPVSGPRRRCPKTPTRNIARRSERRRAPTGAKRGRGWGATGRERAIERRRRRSRAPSGVHARANRREGNREQGLYRCGDRKKSVARDGSARAASALAFVASILLLLRARDVHRLPFIPALHRRGERRVRVHVLRPRSRPRPRRAARRRCRRRRSARREARRDQLHALLPSSPPFALLVAAPPGAYPRGTPRDHPPFHFPPPDPARSTAPEDGFRDRRRLRPSAHRRTRPRAPPPPPRVRR